MQRHFRPRGLARRLSRLWTRVLDGLLVEDGRGRSADIEQLAVGHDDADKRAFFGPQVHIAMEHYGRLDPLDLDECLAHDGFEALARCLGVPSPKPQVLARMIHTQVAADGSRRHLGCEISQAAARTRDPLPPEAIITTIEQSGLRGRGGAGFPTGQKWRMVRKQPGDTKYVICNGDEGDPGAFMDRMILESFPYRVIEGWPSPPSPSGRTRPSSTSATSIRWPCGA